MSFLKEITNGIDLEQASFERRVVNDINQLSGNSKKRITFKQTEAMMLLHSNLNSWLRRKINFQTGISLISATGAIRGSSPYIQAQRHRRKSESGKYYFPRYFWAIDLKDAFQHVLLEKLVEIFSVLTRPENFDEIECSLFLEKFCFSSEQGGLVVGASASADLFNIYCAVTLDEAIRAFCTAHNISYTRYLDDLIFFSNDPFRSAEKTFIRNVVVHAGFSVNDRKTVQRDLTKGSVSINGISVDIDGNIFINRKFTASLKGLLHKVLFLNANISEDRVSGKIQVFLQGLAANGRLPNKTEAKVLKLCHHFMEQQKEIRTRKREEKNSKKIKSITYWSRIRYGNYEKPF